MNDPPVLYQDTYIQTVSVAVPPTTAWQPQLVQRFMHSLFSVPTAITFRITIRDKDIGWSVDIPRNYTEAVEKTVYSFYPGAGTSVDPKRIADIGYYVFQFEGAAPFIASFKHAEDVASLDPLHNILNSLTDLTTSEHVIYELVLTPITEEQYALGEQLATTSVIRWWHFLSLRSAAESTLVKALGWDKVDRFTPEVQKRVHAKLNGPLMQAFLRLKIRTQHKGRATYLASQIEPAFAAFEREGYNFLVQAQPHSSPLVLSPAEAAALWHPPTVDCRTPGIRWAGQVTTPPPTELLHQAKGILLGRNRYQGRYYEVRLPFRDRVTHVSLVGKTRVGKSTLLHRMAHQDIGLGRGVAVIDPHGYLVKHILATSIPERREQDVVLLDLDDRAHAIGLNLLSAPPQVPKEVAADHALAVIRKMFADQWSATRTEDALYAALISLMNFGGGTILDIPRLLNDSEFRHRVLSQVHDPVALEFWFHEYEPLTERHKREIARPVNNRVRRFYRDPTIRRIVGQQHSLDFREVLDEGKIFLANLRGAAGVEGEVLGALLIAKLQMAAMSRAGSSHRSPRPYYLYIDEVQNFVTTSLATMLSGAGKYGLSLVLANQYLHQLTGETLEAVLGNVGTNIVFGVGPRDARIFGRFIKPQYTGSDLEKLSRFHAIVKMQLDARTLPAFSMETLPPLEPYEDAGRRIARIRTYSNERYARRAEEVDAEMAARFKQGSDKALHGGISIEEMDFLG